jgi:hypothetical protein
MIYTGHLLRLENWDLGKDKLEMWPRFEEGGWLVSGRPDSCCSWFYPRMLHSKSVSLHHSWSSFHIVRRHVTSAVEILSQNKTIIMSVLPETSYISSCCNNHKIQWSVLHRIYPYSQWSRWDVITSETRCCIVRSTPPQTMMIFWKEWIRGFHTPIINVE